ncbi:MAG: ATP-binding cassette domain-containing protein [Pirellulales bacterium]
MIYAYQLRKEFYWGGGTVVALDGVSFGVSAGEVYGLLGPNGAGKTTTLRIVMGLIEADEGYVDIGGQLSTSSAGIRSHIGMVSTNDGVYPWLSAREMLLYFADLYAIPPKVAHSRLQSLAEKLQIESILDQRCATLSTGQRQRIILARGLMHDPPVMLLDEPTRGLDVVGSQTVFEFIAHLREMGKAVVLSTHRLDEAERVCDRFGLLHRGRLIYNGTLTEVRKETGKEHLTDMFLSMMRDREQQGGDKP